MSKEATSIYSTWLSPEPRGYCERSRLEFWASACTRFGADSEECCESASIDEELKLGSEVRSMSAKGGCGDLCGREVCDILEGYREAGSEGNALDGSF